MSFQLGDYGKNQSFRLAVGNLSKEQQKKYYAESIDSNFEGFIHHPTNFPLSWRKRRVPKKQESEAVTGGGQIGLCFVSDKYIKPGTHLELTIPLRGNTEHFIGQVILVRKLEEQFEIGVWFDTREDAGRVRIVEQICHIENYLKQKRHQDGPFFSHERVAQEWVSRFASRFPSFG